MLNEAHFHNARRLGTWLPLTLRDGLRVRVRLFGSHEDAERAAAYWYAGVALTDPFSTALEAVQSAMDIIYQWRDQNPYSNLGYFVGLLLQADDRYVGGYQTRQSAS